MIISASRRTDIPAFYGDWFYERIRQGFADIRNPVNQHQVSRIALSSDLVECIVFWTKNPSDGFIKKLVILDKLGYTYYFQFTVTSYNQSIEPGIPKKEQVIRTFRMLSEKIGKDKVVWRYDPVLISDEYTVEYHIRYFDYIASKLSGFTDTCIVSFLDSYPHIRHRLAEKNIREPTAKEILVISEGFSETAKKYGLCLQTCCEAVDLQQYGITPAHCIDGDRINRITGKHYLFKKDTTQRKPCGCVKSIDIGSYSTCRHGCIYCYADRSFVCPQNCRPESPLLCSELQTGDKVTVRKMIKAPIESESLNSSFCFYLPL